MNFTVTETTLNIRAIAHGLALAGLLLALSGCGCSQQEPEKAKDNTQELAEERMTDPVYMKKLNHQEDELKKARHAIAVAIAAYDKAKNDGADEATLKPLEAALKQARADYQVQVEATKLIIRDRKMAQEGR